MSKPVLFGFDGSTYVRTVRMVLHDKGADYDQVPVNVLEGEPRQPEHLERHPFGKVPVLDHDGLRLIETAAIAPYLDEVLPGPSVTPDNAKDRARMRSAMSVIDAYGYGALVGAAGFHLFPDLIGNPDEETHKETVERAKLVLKTLMGIRGGDPYIAGSKPSLADYYLAPICFYVSLTPEADTLLGEPSVKDWWERMQGVESFKATEPDLG
jgi:glutathione S-transferase